MHSRRKYYETLGKPMDNTVDIEAVERYYAQLG
jgi:hypothetical protein